MSLKFAVESLDAIPEAQRNLYSEKDGKFVLNVEGYEDPAGLKSALQKEREAARNATKQASAWQSIGKTPEEIQQVLEAQRKADEDKLNKAGEWDKLKGQMLTTHQAELAKKDESLKSLRGHLERHLVDAAGTAAIASAKGVPALLLPHVKAAVKVIEEDGQFVVRVVDQAGNPRVNGKGDYLSITDLVGEMRQSEIFGRAFEASGTTGGGAGPSGSAAGAKTMTRAQFDALDPASKAKAARESKIID